MDYFAIYLRSLCDKYIMDTNIYTVQYSKQKCLGRTTINLREKRMKIAICDSSAFFMSKFIDEVNKINPKISITTFKGYNDLIDSKDLLQ